MNQFDHGDTDDEALAHIVYGDLPVPVDAEDVGEFVDTPIGKVRTLTFPAKYSNPLPGDDGELVPQEVRLMGYQALNGEINYSVFIDVTAVLGPDEAALVAAAIKDAVEDANRNNE